MANSVNAAIVPKTTEAENELVAPTPRPARSSTLNPMAAEWSPSINKSSEDERCLYLTFSNGYPLTEGEISSFFVQNFGAGVETVYVHRRQNLPGDNQEAAPLFGKVIFSSMCMPAIIMNGEERREFAINRRTMWCKRFIARAERHQQGALNL